MWVPRYDGITVSLDQKQFGIFDKVTQIGNIMHVSAICTVDEDLLQFHSFYKNHLQDVQDHSASHVFS